MAEAPRAPWRILQSENDRLQERNHRLESRVRELEASIQQAKGKETSLRDELNKAQQKLTLVETVSKPYIAAIFDGDGCPIQPHHLNEPAEEFAEKLYQRVGRMYEDHLMFLNNDQMPNDPNIIVKIYMNVEGMVQTWVQLDILSSASDASFSMTSPSKRRTTYHKDKDALQIRQWLEKLNDKDRQLQVFDTGAGTENADVAVKVSFEHHVGRSNCVALILGGVTHDKGYLNVLNQYLSESRSDGGKVVLMAAWKTESEYMKLPFQITLQPTLFKIQPLRPNRQPGSKPPQPLQKPRGLLRDHFEPCNLMSNRREATEVQVRRRHVGTSPAEDWFLIWVRWVQRGPVPVYCTLETTVSELIQLTSKALKESSGEALPEPLPERAYKLTADGGQTYLCQWDFMTVNEMGFRWGATVELRSCFT